MNERNGSGATRYDLRRVRMSNPSVPALLARARPAVLALNDGATFAGFVSGGAAVVSGEVVFNTSMTGYQDMVTDPSYRGQILVLTTPHVGVVGWNGDDSESKVPWVEALIVADLETQPSNWRSLDSLPERLAAREVPVAWGFDTRAIVLHLREHGALPGVLVCGRVPTEAERVVLLGRAVGTDGRDLAREVARPGTLAWDEGPWSPGAHEVPGPPSWRATVIDCGVKHSILRRLRAAGAAVTTVPPAATAGEILATAPDGVVISNGPGDPAAVHEVPETIRVLLGQVPLLGICLGHQLLAIALGGRTCKLRFGHHGGNHPVRDHATGAVWITSQNHNYAVDAASLPTGTAVTMTNLTDGSVEGLACAELAAEGVQFHPEGGPGPHDALGIFDRFAARCGRDER